MTSAKPIGFLSSSLRSTTAWLALGLGGAGIGSGIAVVDINNSNNQLHIAQGKSQELDNRMHSLELVRLQRDNREQNRQLAETFREENDKLRTDLTDTKTELANLGNQNVELARRLAVAERNLSLEQDKRDTLITRFTSEVDEKLATKADADALVRTIARVKPSCVMMSSNHGLEKWAGFFLKTNGNELYLATCAHSFKDAGDFILTNIKVEGEGFTFEITPPPFKDNKIAYFSAATTDLALIPIPFEILTTLPKNIGLSFRDFERNPLKEGEQVFGIGNPLGLENTVTVRTITHPSREHPGLKNGVPYVQIQPSPNPGDSGSALIDAKGNLIGLTVQADPRGFARQGYAVGGEHLVDVLQERCGLPLKPRTYFVTNESRNPNPLPDYSNTKKAELAKRQADPNDPLNWLLGLFEPVPGKVVPPPPVEVPLPESVPDKELPIAEVAPPAPAIDPFTGKPVLPTPKPLDIKNLPDRDAAPAPPAP